MRSLWLMYHDIYAEPNPEVPRSAAMYHVAKDAFESQLKIIQASGLQVALPQEALGPTPGQALVITFDDGWAGTFRHGIPLLAKYSFPAAVFVTRDFVGRKFFCDVSMLREAAEAGIEIGVHGTTHRMLSALGDDELFSEFTLCKDFLEQALSRPIRIASAPGGDSNDFITAAARRAGLDVLATSRPGINGANTSTFQLKRLAIRASTDSRAMERFSNLDVSREAARWTLFQGPRLLLGMKNYHRLRRAVLDRNKTTEVFLP